MNLYTYTFGNLLEKPNTYFYTEYHGLDFLEAWKSDRERVRAKLGNELPPFKGKPDLFESLLAKIAARKSLDAHFIFDAVQGALAGKKDHGNTPELKRLINKLVQRFEVSKRWYPEYEASFRAKVKTVYDDLELYVRGAEIFDAAHAQFGELPYLNALLKSIDTLCSIHEKLNADQKGRLARLISRESHYINSLK